MGSEWFAESVCRIHTWPHIDSITRARSPNLALSLIGTEWHPQPETACRHFAGASGNRYQLTACRERLSRAVKLTFADRDRRVELGYELPCILGMFPGQSALLARRIRPSG